MYIPIQETLVILSPNPIQSFMDLHMHSKDQYAIKDRTNDVNMYIYKHTRSTNDRDTCL